VRGLTECLWQELEGSGVRAVCVHPGGIRTGIAHSARRCRNAGSIESELAADDERMVRDASPLPTRRTSWRPA
jgi:NAD(P)-dependent dehydrogenase (short-subunit alcohol dehydrogenase family)